MRYSLRQLEVFLATARFENVTRAADSLLEIATVLVDPVQSHRAVEDVDILLGDVDVVKKSRSHPPVVAL